MVADREDPGVEEAHDVAGARLVHRGAVVGHHRRARGQLDLAVALHVVGVHAALEAPRAHAQKRHAVAVVLVHVGLDLEDKAREGRVDRGDLLAREGVRVRARGGRHAQEVAQERLHAEVGERRAKEDRRELARAHGLEVELVVRAVEELDVVHEGAVVLLANELVERGVAELRLHLGHALGGVGATVALKGEHVAARAVKDAAEGAAVADRPVHGVGPDAEHALDLLHEVEGVARLVVELVDEGEDGDAAQRAHLEELDRLRLHALGTVDHHDRGVGGHERAVGVLGEVLVAGGVQDVHAVALVGKLQHRRRHGDTALLLDVHPVGHRVLGAALSLDRAGRLDAAGVEQQLLGERGLARVRVRDDGERSPRGDLLSEAWHGLPPLQTS